MEFIIYKKYNEKVRVEFLANTLKENGIDFEVTEDRDSLDSLYGGNQLTKNYYIKIRKQDFDLADSLLLTISEDEVNAVEEDHYLYGFTNEELFEILSKPDEWNEFDYQLSKKILKERGKEINDDVVKLLKKQRLNELSKPDEGHRNWMYAGYIFALLGGLLGVFIGWHLTTFKKTLPNGQRVHGYTEADRRHGRRILIIGIIMFCIMMIGRLATEF
jgi:hypothetical protein